MKALIFAKNQNNMKRFILSVFALSLISFAQAQNETKVSSEIEEVTVFLNGAQVTREARVNLRPGTNLVKLTELTSNLNPNSIQVSSDKNVTIVSVNHQYNYMEEPKKSRRYNEVKDSLDDVTLKLQLRRSIKQVYLEEKNLLLANKNIGGENTGVNIDDLMEMADYFRSRLKDIETKILDAQIEEREYAQLQQKLQNQLNQLQGQRYKNTSEIVVNISSKITTSATLNVTYHVYNAGWIPMYDIRSNSVEGPVKLTYRANVHQTTGYDWENVKIKLSTGNPATNQSKPNLSPWILRYYNVNTGGIPASYGYTNGGLLDLEDDEVALEEVEVRVAGISRKDKKESESLSNFTDVVEAGVNTEFDIKIPYSVSTDGSASTVEIQQYALDAGYTYYAAPKHNKHGFLMADVTGWGDLSLLPGESSIFYEGTYVGKSYLNPNITEDTLNLSMGIDKGVIVERNKLTEQCKNVTIGSNKKTTMRFEIVVRNTKNKPIDIIIEDQIPISQIKDIEVSLDEKTGNPEYKEEKGFLKWRVKLDAGATVKYQFQYTVKHPKDKAINL